MNYNNIPTIPVENSNSTPNNRKPSRFSVEKAPDALKLIQNNPPKSNSESVPFLCGEMTNPMAPQNNQQNSIHNENNHNVSPDPTLRLNDVSKVNNGQSEAVKFKIISESKKEIPDETNEFFHNGTPPQDLNYSDLIPSSSSPILDGQSCIASASTPVSSTMPVPPPNTPVVHANDDLLLDPTYPTLPILITTTSRVEQGGRFKRVYVNGQFPRGRWKCCDFKDSDPVTSRSDIIALADKDKQKGRSSQSSSTASSINLPGQDAQDLVSGFREAPPPNCGVPGGVTTIVWSDPNYMPTTDICSISRVSPPVSVTSSPRGQVPNTSTTQGPVSCSTIYDNPATECNTRLPLSVNPVTSNILTLWPALFGTQLGGGSDRLDGTIPPAGSPQINSHNAGNIQGPSGTAGGANVVAIDNKIEQAMDLVKTHLMYAVREEIEVLRAKIQEMDKTVFRLETENALLRDRVPQDVAQNITAIVAQQMSSTPQTTPQSQ